MEAGTHDQRDRTSSAPSATTDVLVVGAGPTGLLAAGLLARCGVSLRIIDKNPSPAKESRAFGIQARSMELFASIGLADTLMERGLIATGAQVYVDGARAAELNFDDIGRADTPFSFLLMVPQSEIEAVLAEDVDQRGIAVERGITALGLDQSAEGVRVRVADAEGRESAIAARYVIGADGAHSIVRKALGLSFEGGAYPQTFLLADVAIRWPLDYDHFKIFLGEHDFAAYLPLKGRDYGRVMVMDPDTPDRAAPAQGSSPVALAVVEAAFRRATGTDVSLSDPRWLSRYRVHHRGVDRYGVGRAFVAGDAAHIHSPAGGQGMNTGLQDVGNLAWKLALVLGGKAQPALLDTYHDERWPVGHRVLAYTDRIFSFVGMRSGWAATLRNLVMPAFAALISKVGVVRNRAFHFISQLGIRYEPNAFLAEGSSEGAPRAWRSGPAPGHRAPNAAIGRRQDVFDLLEGYRFHLLALSRTPLSDAEIGQIVEAQAGFARTCALPVDTHLVAHSLLGRDARLIQAESAAVFETYGIGSETPQGLYLVRPDGYVAWRADSLDVEGCRRFVAATFGAGS